MLLPLRVSNSAVVVPEQLSVWSLALKGGWIMAVLLLLSLVACYIFVERLLLPANNARALTSS